MYFYNDGINDVGPLTEDALMALLESQIISESTLVRKSESAEWPPVSDLLSSFREPSSKMERTNVMPASEEKLSEVEIAYPKKLPTTSNELTEKRSKAEKALYIETGENWTTAPHKPWRRYGAKIIDGFILGLMGLYTLIALISSASRTSAFRFERALADPEIVGVLLIGVSAATVGGVLVGLMTQTPGKWVFGIKVVLKDGNKLGIVRGVERELHLWFAGMALGIPLISLFTMWFSYKRLEEGRSTLWDAGKYIVAYREEDGQNSRNAAGIIIILVLFTLVYSHGL